MNLKKETRAITPENLRKMPTAVRYFDSKGHFIDEKSEAEIQKAGVPYYAVRLHYTTRGNTSKDAQKFFFLDKEQRQLTLYMTPPKGECAEIPNYPFSVSGVWNYGNQQNL